MLVPWMEKFIRQGGVNLLGEPQPNLKTSRAELDNKNIVHSSTVTLNPFLLILLRKMIYKRKKRC